MFLDIVFLILGLVLILVGANALTDGASALAKRWGMSDLVVGLTIVAFGTSAPELVISVMSAARGNAGIAIGNVVGSNIFNVCAIIGITALVRPIRIAKGIMTTDIPLVILSALVLLVMGNATLLDGALTNVLTRVDGVILLLFFMVFMHHTFASAKKADPSDPAASEGKTRKMMPLWKSSVWVVGGLAALIYGGDRFVDGASGIASATAALKGRTGIALGNVIGSNIFNIFLVLGCSATVRQLPFGTVGNVDLLVLVGGCALFWLFGHLYKVRTIARWEGAALLSVYVGYLAWTVAGA